MECVEEKCNVFHENGGNENNVIEVFPTFSWLWYILKAIICKRCFTVCRFKEGNFDNCRIFPGHFNKQQIHLLIISFIYDKINLTKRTLRKATFCMDRNLSSYYVILSHVPIVKLTCSVFLRKGNGTRSTYKHKNNYKHTLAPAGMQLSIRLTYTNDIFFQLDDPDVQIYLQIHQLYSKVIKLPRWMTREKPVYSNGRKTVFGDGGQFWPVCLKAKATCTAAFQ